MTTSSAVHRVVLPIGGDDGSDGMTVQLKGFRHALHAAATRPHIDKDGTNFELWYVADPVSDEQMGVRIYVEGTGFPFNHRATHISTFTTDGGAFVWHVFVEYPLEEKLQ